MRVSAEAQPPTVEGDRPGDWQEAEGIRLTQGIGSHNGYVQSHAEVSPVTTAPIPAAHDKRRARGDPARVPSVRERPAV